MIDRVPAWIKRAVQVKGLSHFTHWWILGHLPHSLLLQTPHRPPGQSNYEGLYTEPSKYKWKHERPSKPRSPRIYEVVDLHRMQQAHSKL